MRHLAFRLFGPFASWGDIAVGEHRPTLDGPTKSAVLGLVAGALGWRRENNDEQHLELANSLGLAVVIHETGRWMRDYHTAMEPVANKKAPRYYASRKEELEWLIKNYRKEGKANWKFNTKALATDITRRDYRLDALSTVLLWRRKNASSAVPSLEQIQTRLHEPHFVPYLGRKANPLALPLTPKIVDCETLREAAEATRTALPNAPFNDDTFKKIESVRYDIDHPATGLDQNRSIHTRRDGISTRDSRRWQFQDRHEYHQHWSEQD